MLATSLRLDRGSLTFDRLTEMVVDLLKKMGPAPVFNLLPIRNRTLLRLVLMTVAVRFHLSYVNQSAMH